MKNASNIITKNNYILITFLLIIAILSSSCTKQKTKLNTISFNIRFDNPEDGNNAWENRKELVVEFIKSENPDILGMQEVLKSQLDYLTEYLPEYLYYGLGRDDGKEKGEFSPIFFKKDKFKLLDSLTIWLSETPEIVGSVGEGAVLPRILTIAKLKIIASGEEVYFLNTHFSHVSDDARTKAAKIVMKYITDNTENLPVILSGDFNFLKKSDGYKIITGDKNNFIEMFNSRYISQIPFNNDAPEGCEHTCNLFSDKTKYYVIDYIFVNSKIKVLNHKILKIKRDNIFISDHWPIKSEMELFQ